MISYDGEPSEPESSTEPGPGDRTGEAWRISRLEREVEVLKDANELLRAIAGHLATPRDDSEKPASEELFEAGTDEPPDG